MKRIITLSSIVALTLGIISCDNENLEGDFEPTDYTVKGKVEKGPFISGSTINLQPMNAKLSPNGSTYTTLVTDNAGNYAFNTTTLETPYVQLTANGYFYNEISGNLSNGTLSLRALVNLADQSSVNINVLTHLKYARVLDLIEKDKKSYKEANKQAQEELLGAFGLQRYADTDVSNISISSGTPEAGALIAISSLIMINRNEAQMSEYLAKLSNEFGEMGAFSVETKEIIKKDREAIYKILGNIRWNTTPSISENIIKRYEELGQAVTVLPLYYYYDWDDDGIAGNEFYDKDDNPPTLSAKEIIVPKEGGQYLITIESEIKLYTAQLNSLNEVTLDNFWSDLYDRDMNPGIIEATLSGDSLKISVSETKSRRRHITEIRLYDYSGYDVACLNLIQEGNPELPAPRMGNDAQSVVASGYSSMMSAMKYMVNYVNNYGEKEDRSWYDLMDPKSSLISNLYYNYYRALDRINTVSDFDLERDAAFIVPVELFRSIAYYNMITLWGGVPYVTHSSLTYSNDLPRTPESLLLDTLQNILESILPELEEKKNAYNTDINDIFYSSKDVARILLADIYMYRNQYDKAKPYLNDVVATDHYNLNPEDDIIMAYVSDERDIPSSNYKTYQLFTYSDVLLSLAECDYNLNNMTEAWTNARLVSDAKQTFKDTTAPEGLLEYISAVRKKSMNNIVGRFAFLKRTGLAKTELWLFDDYQLLLPIPYDELRYNHNITQNPGYEEQ
jgi:hypothetical protein